MVHKKVYGKWQERVQKVLLKRCLQERQTTSGETAAKTADQKELPAQNMKQE